jgi:hypothetical protein
MDYDGTIAVRSADHIDVDDGWTTVPAKNKKGKDPGNNRKLQEPKKAKDFLGFLGIKLVEHEIYGFTNAPVSNPPVLVFPGTEDIRGQISEGNNRGNEVLIAD